MSRAFIKEPDGDSPADWPARPVSSETNYVTKRGLEQLHERLRDAERRLAAVREEAVGEKQERAHVEAEIHWLQARISSARLVTGEGQARDQVAFGASVTLAGDDGRVQTYRIVGEDEADPARGLVSWVSPLARALIGARVGHVVTWQRPAGNIEVEVRSIRYGTGRSLDPHRRQSR